MFMSSKKGILLFSGLETPPLHVGFFSGTQKLMVKILGFFFSLSRVVLCLVPCVVCWACRNITSGGCHQKNAF